MWNSVWIFDKTAIKCDINKKKKCGKEVIWHLAEQSVRAHISKCKQSSDSESAWKSASQKWITISITFILSNKKPLMTAKSLLHKPWH